MNSFPFTSGIIIFVLAGYIYFALIVSEIMSLVGDIKEKDILDF